MNTETLYALYSVRGHWPRRVVKDICTWYDWREAMAVADMLARTSTDGAKYRIRPVTATWRLKLRADAWLALFGCEGAWR